MHALTGRKKDQVHTANETSVDECLFSHPDRKTVRDVRAKQQSLVWTRNVAYCQSHCRDSLGVPQVGGRAA